MTTYDYDEMIKALKKLLADHNAALPAAAKKVDPEAILATMLEEGWTDAEGLQSLTEADFVRFGFPVRRARQAAAMVNPQPSGAAAATAGTPTHGSPTHGSPSTIVLQDEVSLLRKMSDVELIRQYNLRNPGLVGDVLNERAGGGAFLVFTDLNMTHLDAEASAKRLSAIQDGVPLSAFVMVGGVPVAPVRVGEKPEKLLEENPLYPGQPLGEDETCLVTNESWKGVPHDVRALLNLAVADGTLRALNPEIARGVIEEAHGPEALAKFTRRYQRTAARLAQMTASERPSLKIRWGAERRLHVEDLGPAPYATADVPAAPAARFTGTLSGSELRLLRDALLDAFRSRRDLDMMLSDQLHVHLDHITGQGSLASAVFDLIQDAQAKGYTGDLVAAAKRTNPGNPKLRAFTLGGAAAAPPTDHEIHAAVLSSGLTNSRRALLAGIDPRFAGMIPDAGNPSAQVLIDVNHLRSARLSDGSNPWRTWLTNAISQVGPRVEADVFRRALAAAG